MYDLIIIGAGPGGYVAAIKASQLGMKVAVAEKAEVGGTCLNRGCIPAKALLHSAELAETARHAEDLGICFDGIKVDFTKLYERKNQVTDKLRSGVAGLLKGNGVTLVQGTAQITGPQEVSVDGEKLTASKILIATGSKPAVPPIKGSDLPNVITSDDLLKDTPDFKRMVIVGGGVIGVEFASVFSALGCEITIVEACDTLLPNLDKEIGKKIALSLKKKGVAIHTKASVSALQELAGDMVCTFASKNKEQTVSCDKILIATGRRAVFEDLFTDGIDCAGDRHGLLVNGFGQTSIPSIYAIGDVVSYNIQLAHVASAQGINAVLHMNGKAPQYDMSLVPSCVYTAPEIACVGLDEAEAKAKDIPVKAGKYNMAGNGKSIIAGHDLGFIKVISHAETGVLLGAQLMCGNATDMVVHFAQMIRQKVTVEEALAVIYPHPTFSEGIAEALESVTGLGIHVMPKR